MCLDTRETAVIPEPRSPPAGGHEYMSALRCAHGCVVEVTRVRSCVIKFNKLTGLWCTIC